MSDNRFDDLFKDESAQVYSSDNLVESVGNGASEDTQDSVNSSSYDTAFAKPYVQQEQGTYVQQFGNNEPVNDANARWNAYNANANFAQANPYQHGADYAQQTQIQRIKPKKEKRRLPIGFVAVMLVVCVVVSAVAGVAGAMYYTQKKAENVQISTNGAMVINKVEIDEQTAQKLADKSTAQITEEVADSVVEITTEVMTTNNFYGQYISQGAGSGVIISTDGYIVTNNHVIDGATSVTVTLRDKTSYSAVLVGTDSIVDIALLKIEATGLKAATFGDSDKLKVGDKAVAIGNPLGQLGGTVTDGIISALDRDVVIDEETMNLLQTDTAINPGNSGGGLFDGQGSLIGVVVAKSSGEEIEGLGFAIPVNDVIDIIDDLKEYGYVRGRVSLGMDLMDLSNEMYSMYYFGNSKPGCYVYTVERGSNAEAVGIKQGDRIVSVNSTEITAKADVDTILKDASVGDVITIEIERLGQTATTELELEEYVPTTRSSAEQSDVDLFEQFGF